MKGWHPQEIRYFFSREVEEGSRLKQGGGFQGFPTSAMAESHCPGSHFLRLILLYFRFFVHHPLRLGPDLHDAYCSYFPTDAVHDTLEI